MINNKLRAHYLQDLQTRAEADGGTFENMEGASNYLQALGRLDPAIVKGARLIIQPCAVKSGIQYGSFPNTKDADMTWTRNDAYGTLVNAL